MDQNNKYTITNINSSDYTLKVNPDGSMNIRLGHNFKYEANGFKVGQKVFCNNQIKQIVAITDSFAYLDDGYHYEWQYISTTPAIEVIYGSDS